MKLMAQEMREKWKYYTFLKFINYIKFVEYGFKKGCDNLKDCS